MQVTPVAVGALFVALGSTIQAVRWLWVESGRLRARATAASKRSERVAVERDGRADLDILAWVLISVGRWYTFASSI